MGNFNRYLKILCFRWDRYFFGSLSNACKCLERIQKKPYISLSRKQNKPDRMCISKKQLCIIESSSRIEIVMLAEQEYESVLPA